MLKYYKYQSKMQSFTHGVTFILLKNYVCTLICLYTHTNTGKIPKVLRGLSLVDKFGSEFHFFNGIFSIFFIITIVFQILYSKHVLFLSHLKGYLEKLNSDALQHLKCKEYLASYCTAPPNHLHIATK